MLCILWRIRLGCCLRANRYQRQSSPFVQGLGRYSSVGWLLPARCLLPVLSSMLLCHKYCEGPEIFRYEWSQCYNVPILSSRTEGSHIGGGICHFSLPSHWNCLEIET